VPLRNTNRPYVCVHRASMDPTNIVSRALSISTATLSFCFNTSLIDRHVRYECSGRHHDERGALCGSAHEAHWRGTCCYVCAM